MKTNHLKHSGIAALLAGALVAPSSAQTEAFGDILGYYKFDVPAGNSVWVCGLVKKKDFQGAATSFTSEASSVINLAGTPFTANQFSRHYIEVLEAGSWEGFILDITANTTNSITLEGNLGALTGLSSTPVFCIREHVTLNELLPEGGGLQSQDQDSISLFYPDGSTRSFLFGDVGLGGINWYDPNALVVADDEVIFPGQGFLVFSGSNAEIMVGKNGVTHVKDTPTYIPLYAGAINLIGLIDPVVATNPADPIFPSTDSLGSTGLQDFLSLDLDSVTLFDNNGGLSAIDTFLTTEVGGSPVFFEPDSLTIANGQAFSAGTAFVVSVSSDKSYQQPVPHP